MDSGSGQFGSGQEPEASPHEQADAHSRMTIEAPIVAVAVYPASARVTRRGTVRAGSSATGTAGVTIEVVVDDLPRRTETDSVRVTGRGAVRIVGVDVRDERKPATTEKALVALVADRDSLRQRLAELADADDAQHARRGFLDVVVRTGAASLARSLAVVPTTTDAAAGPAADATTAAVAAARRLTVVSDLLVEQIGDVQTQRRRIAEQREEAERRLAAVERTIDSRRNITNPDTRQVVVTIESLDGAAGVGGAGGGSGGAGGGSDGAGGGSDGAIEAELEVSYVVPDAGWTSVYDARLAGEQLTLTWFGLVTQRTGEDWPACELTLSTARPAAGARLPELDPWYVGIASNLVRARSSASAARAARDDSGPLPPPMVLTAGSALPPGSMPVPPAAAAAAARPAETATAALDAAGSAASYRLARPVPVPADGTPHRTTVAALELDVALDYLTVPKLAPEAHLRATVTNTTDHTIRPGKVSIFHGAEFVGSSRLSTVPPGAEFELHLGIDDRLAVERELVRRNTGKRMVGNARRTDFGYRIKLANHTGRTARVTLNDQLPVSTNADVEIRDEQTSPNPDERSELGMLTWTLVLDPEQERQIDFGFRVEHPRGAHVTGF